MDNVIIDAAAILQSAAMSLLIDGWRLLFNIAKAADRICSEETEPCTGGCPAQTCRPRGVFSILRTTPAW